MNGLPEIAPTTGLASTMARSLRAIARAYARAAAKNTTALRHGETRQRNDARPRRSPLLCAGIVAFISAAGAAPLAAHHEAPTHYDRIHLSASAEREVDTDTLRAEMYMQHQSSSQATAADEVNRAVLWAIEQAKAAEVKVTTSSYRTQPVYQKRHIQAWRVYQSITLESTDGERLAALLGDLQRQLSISSLHDVLSDEARKNAEEALITEALTAFGERAATVATALGRSGHRIVELNINSGVGAPPQVMMRGAMAMESAAKVAAPAIESGTLRVQVQVSGTIELTAP